MLHVYVAFIDGDCIEEEVPNEALDIVIELFENTPRDYISRFEIEDNDKTIVYQYKKETYYVY